MSRFNCFPMLPLVALSLISCGGGGDSTGVTADVASPIATADAANAAVPNPASDPVDQDLKTELNQTLPPANKTLDPSLGKDDAAGDTHEIASKSVELNVRTTAREYWTPERLRDATPYEARSRTVKQEGFTIRADEPVGEAEWADGYAGDAALANGGERLAPALDEKQIEPAPSEAFNVIKQISYKFPYPYTGAMVTLNYKSYPYSTIGRLFFTQRGVDYVCSASAVDSANKRLVITAGHCVVDFGAWSTNVVFVPAYKNGAAPLGAWSACGLYAPRAWIKDGDFARDIGAIKICDRNGKRLHQVTGALGFLANAPRIQHWNSFGYPASYPFSGERMFTCQSSHALDDYGSPAAIGVGCDMTGGSSGGPWIARFEFGKISGHNLINGIVSYGYFGEPNTMYSPYFGGAFLELRRAAMAKGA